MVRWVTRLALLALVAFLVRAFWLEPRSLQTREVTLPVSWPYARPLRVAVLSDLHVGAPYYGMDRLREVVARTNAAHPDLICLLGDFVTLGVLGGHFVPPDSIADVLAGLRAPLGVVAVMGNHDRRWDAGRVGAALRRVGIADLEDSAAVRQASGGPVWIAGVSDYWTGRHDLAGTLAQVTDPRAPLLLITHNPDLFPEVPGRVTLTLAGHTHGGQVRFPLFGALVVPSSYGQRFVAGSIVEGGRRLFVSTGLGTSDLPIRFRVPPTIFILTLRSAAVPTATARRTDPP
jgi:predicted MPP superfamily phosphohydrolase